MSVFHMHTQNMQTHGDVNMQHAEVVVKGGKSTTTGKHGRILNAAPRSLMFDASNVGARTRKPSHACSQRVMDNMLTCGCLQCGHSYVMREVTSNSDKHLLILISPKAEKHRGNSSLLSWDFQIIGQYSV